jgi:hypothetical protein
LFGGNLWGVDGFVEAGALGISGGLWALG